MSYLEKYSDEELLKIADSDLKAEIEDRGYKHGWYKPTEYAGMIYVLVNPAFPDLVKIGYADNVEKRVRSFNRNSGLPDPYHVYATYKVKKRLEDLKLHNLIDSLDSDLRHAKNREFYEMSPEKAYGILSAIAEINGDEDLLILNPFNDSYFDENEMAENAMDAAGKERKKTLTFSLLGINVGETLQFAEDESISVVVNGDKTVEFEGQSWKLSALVRELKERAGTGNNSGAYQGGLYFLYKGRRLTDIREEIENE